MSPRLVRAADRAVTTTEWLTSRHGFSFGDHYDPDDTHHGVLLVHNDEIIAPGTGFDTHPHAETEIVTWVLSGTLVHQDSQGHSGLIHPGLAQRMSAGTGILHSERNDPGPPGSRATAAEPVHYLQMWLKPDRPGADPSYQQCDVSTELAAGGLIPLASGDRRLDSAIRIGHSAATLWVAQLAAGRTARIPDSRFTHLFVADGAVTVDHTPLSTGDTLRATGFGGTVIGARTDAQVLIWAMDAALGE
ncbi:MULTISPECIES: pirin family protein [unclassified Gordonia (in: high G+C Gram-positive bacteria)]|uniref:pirin family protein n=1 Tax=unclassified Gordonia (in: high G+C Gram-positive bacteria) TaxID=2657482 RepID=UPI001FFEE8EB|nr:MULTISPECIES: pirin-like bicupin family protein [unclassified Gordonia (in: high G+C Gram-positive bacteria)]UQE74903.1 pirin family protein [Gordonia sp. PP30]